MSARPKRYVRIFGRRVSLQALFYVIVEAILILSLLVPWVHIGAELKPVSVIGSLEGFLSVDIYLWGLETVQYSIKVFATGTELPLSVPVASTFLVGVLVFFVLELIVVALVAMLMLNELEIKKLSENLIARLELVVVALQGLILLVFSFVALTMHSKFSGKTIGFDYVYLYKLVNDITVAYRHTEVNYHVLWGPGYALAFLAFVALFVYLFHRKIVVEKLDLSWYWATRLYLAVFSLFGGFFPVIMFVIFEEYKELSESLNVDTLLFRVVIKENGVSVTLAPILGMFLFVFLVMILVILYIGATRLPARYLMKRTPFITLALPEDEIVRRHKMLPIVSGSLKTVDFIIAALSIIALLMLMNLFIQQYGVFAIDLETKMGVGDLWSTPIAYILALALVIQALMIFIPIRRG